MTETVTIEDKKMKIAIGDKETEVIARVTTTDHGVTDEDGNPKISVNINVPAASLLANGGEQG